MDNYKPITLMSSIKLFLIIYIILLFNMCIFYTPQNIVITVFSDQRVPHSVTVKSEYHPIWYSYYDHPKNLTTIIKNAIDYERLSVQFVTVTIIFSIIIFLLKSSKLIDIEIIKWINRISFIMLLLSVLASSLFFGYFIIPTLS